MTQYPHATVMSHKSNTRCNPDIIADLNQPRFTSKMVVPEKLRTLDRGRPWRDSQFASTRLSPIRDMSR